MRSDQRGRGQADPAKASPAQKQPLLAQAEQRRLIWMHVFRRTKVLLDLESQARISRGSSPERCTPAWLVGELVEKAYGDRWRPRARSSALRADEERRLRGHRAALRLTPRHLELLIHSLKHEAFRITELGRFCGLGRNTVHVAMRNLHRRGLLQLRRFGEGHMSFWHAERGPVLERWLRMTPRVAPRPGSRLRPDEQRRLRHAGGALRLRSRWINLLIHTLRKESFEISQLAQRLGLTYGGTRSALRGLQARDLVRLQPPDPGRPEWHAEKGPALEPWLKPMADRLLRPLSAEQERALRRSKLRLTARRLELLIQSLKEQTFTISEMARLAGMTRQGAHFGLSQFEASGLIRLRRLGRQRWRVEAGVALAPWLRTESDPPAPRSGNGKAHAWRAHP